MRRLFLIPALALLGLFAACSDDNGDNGITAPAGPREGGADPEATAAPDGLQYVVDSLGGNITVEEMRPHLSDDLQSLSDQEISDAVRCFPTDVIAEVTDVTITEDGDSATVDVTWTVTGDAAAASEMTVERTWTFERRTAGDESEYVITGLPSECPFEGADPDQDRQEPAIEPSPTP